MTAISHPWWEHPGLTVRGGRLQIAGRDAEEVARTSGTPLYAYDLTHIGKQIEGLLDVVARAHLRARVRVAMKAQHEPEVLEYIRRRFCLGANGVGVDVSSPGEVVRALDCGWPPDLVSYTGTNVSGRDLDVLLSAPIHINVDGLSQLHRLGLRSPGRSVGVRVNPRIGAAHGMGSVSLYCGGDKPTKFGIAPEKLPEAVAVAEEHGLSIDTLHAHVSRMVLNEDLATYEAVLVRMAECARVLQDLGCPLSEVNVGGGLGVPTREGEQPLDLDRVVSLWVKHLAPLGVAVGSENGEFFSRDAGILLVEVVSVEERDGVVFVGVDAGWNLFNLPFIFGHRHPVVLCRDAMGASTRPVTVAGNINQGPDLFAEECHLPEVREGDILAVLAAGAYAQAASLDQHCLRPHAGDIMFERRVSGA